MSATVRVTVRIGSFAAVISNAVRVVETGPVTSCVA
jgi:hypothetical protein